MCQGTREVMFNLVTVQAALSGENGKEKSHVVQQTFFSIWCRVYNWLLTFLCQTIPRACFLTTIKHFYHRRLSDTFMLSKQDCPRWGYRMKVLLRLKKKNEKMTSKNPRGGMKASNQMPFLWPHQGLGKWFDWWVTVGSKIWQARLGRADGWSGYGHPPRRR